MKKKLGTIIIIVGALMVVIGLLRLLSGDEDTWLCTKQGRVKHGNPLVDKPITGCETGVYQK